MRTFITGEFGRPTAIEVNSWRFSPHHIVEHYPNVDCWDPLSGQDRVPVGRVRNDCPTLEALYEGKMLPFERVRPSLLVHPYQGLRAPLGRVERACEASDAVGLSEVPLGDRRVEGFS